MQRRKEVKDLTTKAQRMHKVFVIAEKGELFWFPIGALSASILYLGSWGLIFKNTVSEVYGNKN